MHAHMLPHTTLTLMRMCTEGVPCDSEVDAMSAERVGVFVGMCKRRVLHLIFGASRQRFIIFCGGGVCIFG